MDNSKRQFHLKVVIWLIKPIERVDSENYPPRENMCWLQLNETSSPAERWDPAAAAAVWVFVKQQLPAAIDGHLVQLDPASPQRQLRGELDRANQKTRGSSKEKNKWKIVCENIYSSLLLILLALCFSIQVRTGSRLNVSVYVPRCQPCLTRITWPGSNLYLLLQRRHRPGRNCRLTRRGWFVYLVSLALFGRGEASVSANTDI